MALNKFCECCDLKEGFKAFVIVLLMLRLLSFSIVPGVYLSIIRPDAVLYGFIIIYCVWNLGSSITLLIALRGLYRNDAASLYPNLIILPIEIFLTIVGGIIVPATTEEPLFALYLLVSFIHIYHFLCIYSLYKKFKNETVTPANTQSVHTSV